MAARRVKRVRLAEVVRELPRGTHDLSRRTVRESQRWRLLEAMTESVGRHGYADASVAHVIEAAAVSRKTFYEFFPDKEACFLTAYEVLSDRLVAALGDLGNSLTAGAARREAQLTAFLAALDRDPTMARVFMVDVLGAGPRALRTRERVNDRFAELLLGDAAISVRRTAVVGGINAVLVRALQEGREKLVTLAPALAAFVEAVVAAKG